MNSCRRSSLAGLALAQHLDLALDQRDRGAAAQVRQAQLREHREVALEELRMLVEIFGDAGFFGGNGGARLGAAGGCGSLGSCLESLVKSVASGDLGRATGGSGRAGSIRRRS
jgi:hypothetical protein